MELVPADTVTGYDLEMRRALARNPDLAREVALLVNAYRAIAQSCIASMHRGDTDAADDQRELAKKDAIMQRLGVPILESGKDWSDAFDGLPWQTEEARMRQLEAIMNQSVSEIVLRAVRSAARSSKEGTHGPEVSSQS